LQSKFSDLPASNAAPAPTAAPAGAANTVHLMIDVQIGCLAGLSPEGAQRYLDHQARMIQELRDNNIPTLWVTITDDNKLVPRKENWSPVSAEPRSAEDFKSMEFFRTEGMADAAKAERINGIFAAFMEKSGPKADEDMFRKRFLDAFVDSACLKENPALYAHLLTHRRDETVADIQQAAADTSLADHLKKLGIEHVVISGMEADVCPVETAMGAVRSGFTVSILADGLATMRDPDFKRTAEEQRRLIKDTLEKITDRPDELLSDPTKTALAGGDVLKEKHVSAIRHIDVTTSQALIADRSAPAAAPTENKPAAPAQTAVAPAKPAKP